MRYFLTSNYFYRPLWGKGSSLPASYIGLVASTWVHMVRRLVLDGPSWFLGNDLEDINDNFPYVSHLQLEVPTGGIIARDYTQGPVAEGRDINNPDDLEDLECSQMRTTFHEKLIPNIPRLRSIEIVMVDESLGRHRSTEPGFPPRLRLLESHFNSVLSDLN